MPSPWIFRRVEDTQPTCASFTWARRIFQCRPSRPFSPPAITYAPSIPARPRRQESEIWPCCRRRSMRSRRRAESSFERPARSLEKVVEELAALRPEAIVVVAYGRLLTAGVLNAAKLGCWNLHALFAAAMARRGADPTSHTVGRRRDRRLRDAHGERPRHRPGREIVEDRNWIRGNGKRFGDPSVAGRRQVDDGVHRGISGAAKCGSLCSRLQARHTREK